MKKKGETKRQRIIIYYVLAIVLPCLILGILALRGIKNDQALVEREQRRNLLEAGQQQALRPYSLSLKKAGKLSSGKMTTGKHLHIMRKSCRMSPMHSHGV